MRTGPAIRRAGIVAAAALPLLLAGTGVASASAALSIKLDKAYWSSSGTITVDGTYTCDPHHDRSVKKFTIIIDQATVGVVRFQGITVQEGGRCTGAPQYFSIPVNAENGTFLPGVNSRVRAFMRTSGGRHTDTYRTLQPAVGP